VFRFLDDGLDELAARSHQGFALRVPITYGVAAIAATMLPSPVCVSWAAVQTLNEAITWFVTRRQARGQAAGARLRSAQLVLLLIGCTIWMVLAGLLWASGRPEGAVCAVILWLSVLFFTQTNAYQSPTGFIVGGALPGLGMLSWVMVGPNPLHLPMLPVFGLFVLALTFATDGAVRTLTARKTIDDARSRLAASEAQYRLLADNITDIITLNEMDGSRTFVSPSIKPNLGYEPEELFASNFDLVHKDDAVWLPAEITRLREARQAGTLHYRLLHKAGHPVWMEAHVSVIEAEDGRPLLLSVSRNIAVRKALENELVEARRHAEAAAAAKSDFLANMTHELRTPLNAIIGFSGILKDSPRLEGEDLRHVGLVHEASETLLGLVNSVLDFSKLEAGAVELEAKPFDPAAVGRAVVGLLAGQAAERGLTLNVASEGEISPLVGDAQRLRQVLLNFLSNALKFTSQGGVLVTVRQTTVEDGADGEARARLRMEVADNGVGIAPDQLATLFDRFTQADASISREYGGTGLGLAICKRTIELMGGAIGVDSRPGEGSTFWFELVLPRAERLIETTEPSSPQDLERPLRVLLAEDVAVNRELIVTLLRPFDVEIETAENGAVAVEMMGARAFDLVLMDVQMPVMDGLTATRAIRASTDHAVRTTPIIAMTANVLPDQVEMCRAAGMDDHLGKPINPAALLGALARWSEGREAAQTAQVAQTEEV
jgi:PAS domain S-box-containing protein